MSPHFESVGHSDDESAPQLVNGTNGTYTNGFTNGYTNGDSHAVTANGSSNTPSLSTKIQHTPKEQSRYLQPASLDSQEDFDLVCVGFGPASLAVAVAIHDAIASGRNLTNIPLPNGQIATLNGSNPLPSNPRVLFIEKQTRFAWHAGMLLPGAKMQISFIKDLATLRDPRSEFTFLNYLHSQGRLVDFTNLDTFLPARVEYEDYMRWAASAFEQVVQYGHQVVSVNPDNTSAATEGGATKLFTVQAQNVESGEIRTCRGRNVLIAAGGHPSLPPSLPQKHSRVIHSSQYASLVPKILNKKDAPYRVTVIGAGQSAAEIFSNIHALYPNSQTRLVMRPEFLRPSDDSPFVNSVFNPEYIDMLYPKSSAHRHNLITEARATNYGVVRLELIEHLYERMYDQRRSLGPDQTKWPHQIMGGRKITSVTPNKSNEALSIRTTHVQYGEGDEFAVEGDIEEDAWEADLIIAATGYRRDAHVDMLRGTWDMLPKSTSAKHFPKGITGWNVQGQSGEELKMAVGRDYQVKFREGMVAEGSGVWLQGCCEGTHGLSDTLLSVLATRSGEIIESIFGGKEVR